MYIYIYTVYLQIYKYIYIPYGWYNSPNDNRLNAHSTGGFFSYQLRVRSCTRSQSISSERRPEPLIFTPGQNHGKPMGNPWKYEWKTMETPWFVQGK